MQSLALISLLLWLVVYGRVSIEDVDSHFTIVAGKSTAARLDNKLKCPQLLITEGKNRMNGPKLTEERIRNHLDSNQVMRERMCLALLPLLGPYTHERPRRPKGGPDGGRDIEAVYQGAIPVWGAVGFKNGGGVDDSTRADAEHKFKTDLDRALEENPSLVAFVFFTNVDLTPTRIELLKTYTQRKNVNIVDIFDMERLRHALDSPEGLIARLHYLDIPMSPTEQLALVSKFGNQLQNAVTARFDRVERTLGQMERFLDWQKPLQRLDVFIGLHNPETSSSIGNEAVLLKIHGLHDIDKTFSCLCINHTGHQSSSSSLITRTYMWNSDKPGKILLFRPSIGRSARIITAYSELSLTTGGQRVRIADLTILRFDAVCTLGFQSKVQRLAIDANGYELFNYEPDGQGQVNTLEWPEDLAYDAESKQWVSLITEKQHNLLFEPPKPSGRFLPLT
ncbi:MAG: hypothetical protein GY796_36680 [Chloroflexi bacterium]|nr:hypothetical protein [Chloroflexota bacterium]